MGFVDSLHVPFVKRNIVHLVNMKTIIFTIAFSFALSVGFSQTAKLSNGYKQTIAVQVFPNPTTSFFNIEGGDVQIATIYLYNLIGKRMKTFYPKKEVDFYVDDLSNGLYLVQMIDGSGNIVATNRLTKR